jgi:hypothetical protein
VGQADTHPQATTEEVPAVISPSPSHSARQAIKRTRHQSTDSGHQDDNLLEDPCQDNYPLEERESCSKDLDLGMELSSRGRPDSDQVLWHWEKSRNSRSRLTLSFQSFPSRGLCVRQWEAEMIRWESQSMPFLHCKKQSSATWWVSLTTPSSARSTPSESPWCWRTSNLREGSEVRGSDDWGEGPTISSWRPPKQDFSQTKNLFFNEGIISLTI